MNVINLEHQSSFRLNKDKENYQIKIVYFDDTVLNICYRRGRSEYTAGADFVKETSNKLNLKISDLEHKCFTLEKDLDVSKTDL